MATLYEINRKIEEILDRLYETVDEETGEVSEDILFELTDLQEERKTKLDNIGAYIKNLEAEAKAIKEEIANLKKRMDAKTRKADRLRQYVAQDLLAHDEKKMETSRIKYSFLPSTQVKVDEALISKKYIIKKIETKVDIAGIKMLLKEGHKIRGAELVENQNLQIK